MFAVVLSNSVARPVVKEDIWSMLIRGNKNQTHDVVLLNKGFARLTPILLITSKEMLTL